MFKKKIVIIILLFCVNRLWSMECVQKDYFSTLPNSCRRPIVFELLRCNILHEAHNQLVSMGLVSRKSYEQTKCPFFMRDIIKFLAIRHGHTNESIATQLRTVGAQKYILMGQNFVDVAQTPSDRRFNHIAHNLLYQGADLNFQSMGSGATPLMYAVASNKKMRVNFFISHGACVHDCDLQNKPVRAFNLIYNKYLLRLNIQPLKDIVMKTFDYNLKNTSRIKLYNALYGVSEFLQFINALLIDRYLADEGASEIVADDEHPLIVLIKEEPVLKSIIKCAFNCDTLQCSRYIPINISRQL